MPFVTLSSNIKIHYIEERSIGPSFVLLLHGLGVNSASWQLQIPALVNAGYSVIAPDSPGFGQSSYSVGKVSIAESAKVFSELLSKLGIQKTHIIGISMGGAQAIQLSLDYGENVDRLILVNTFAKLNLSSPLSWPYYGIRYLLIHTLGIRYQAEAVAKQLFPRTYQVVLREEFIKQTNHANPKAYRACMRAVARFNVKERLSEIKVPTLVVTGGSDTTIRPSDQKVLAIGIPNAQQKIIQGAGHAVTVEKPMEFNKVMLEFLGKPLS